MAEKTVAVRLVARVDAYTAAMAKAAAATGAFSTTSQANLARVGGSMQTIGKRMTTWLTLPIIGVGAVATSMALDFETAFGQISALTNVSADEIDGLKDSVLALSGETAQSPQELADALYFAASAGLDSAAALDVVTVAAQASATGMGSTADVTRVLASVLNVYGESNISAAEAADILTAAVQEGSAAPDEYAESLGAVIPIAASMGVTFDEVAGSVAYLTNQGLSADEAVTALRGALLAMADPSAQGRKTLLDMGTSAGELQAAIAEDGLLGALVLLREHGFVGNSEAMSNLFEDNRALVGATSLLADESGTLGPILDAVANSVGVLGDAFAITADTDAFKMRQALTDVQTAMVQLGVVLLPIVADIAEAFAGLVTWFTDLPPEIQLVLGGFVGLVAVMGPLTFVAGTLIKNLTTVGVVMGLSQTAAGKAATAFSALGVAALVGLAAWKILGEGHLNAGTHITTTADALINATSAAFGEVVAAGEAAVAVDSLALAHEALSLAIADAADDDLSDALVSFNVPAEDTLEVLTNLRGAVSSLGDDMGSADQMIALVESRLGVTRVKAIEFYNSFLTGGNIADGAFQRFAESAGIAVSEVEDTFSDMNVLQKFAIENQAEVADMALAYLDLQVKLGGAGRAAVLAAQDLAGNRREGENAIPVYEEYVRQLVAMEPAQRDAVLSSDEMTASLAGLSPEAVAAALGVGEVTESMEQVKVAAADAAEALAQVLDLNMNQAIQDLSGLEPGGLAMTTESIQAFSQALHSIIDPALNYQAAMDGLQEANIGLGESIEETNDSLFDNSAASLNNRSVLRGYIGDILAIADAQIANGDSMADVTADLETNRLALIRAAAAAGLNADEVAQLTDMLNLVPQDIKVAMTLLGQEFVINEINRVIAAQEGIPEEVFTEIIALIDAGDAYAAHQRLLNHINNSTATADVRIRVVNPTVRFQPGSGAGGKMIAYARGGLVESPEVALVGESGREAILPLTNQSRMMDILGIPGVFGPVAAAMAKLVPSGTASMMGGGSSGSNVNNTNVTIVMPPGSDGDDVVRSLRKWERRRGPIPITVR